MNGNHDFVPRRTTDATNYGALVHRVISAQGYDPAKIGLTPDDVTELGDSVSANQAVLGEIRAVKDYLKSLTKKLNGPKGTHRRMVTNLRTIASKARVSDASSPELLLIRVRRKKTKPSPRKLATDPPALSLYGVIPGFIRILSRVPDSNSPRARAENSMGVQIAVVDAAHPVADNEADDAPIVFKSRSPARLNSSRMPAKVRLYARWISRRGETSGWSLPLLVTVI